MTALATRLHMNLHILYSMHASNDTTCKQPIKQASTHARTHACMHTCRRVLRVQRTIQTNSSRMSTVTPSKGTLHAMLSALAIRCGFASVSLGAQCCVHVVAQQRGASDLVVPPCGEQATTHRWVAKVPNRPARPTSSHAAATSSTQSRTLRHRAAKPERGRLPLPANSHLQSRRWMQRTWDPTMKWLFVAAYPASICRGACC
eukprot:363169-Chlamydomonas_euryale.AAC.23